MKKLVIIPIMFVYLFAVMGIMIHVHYCGQQLESWNLFVENEGCADGSCGDESEQPDDCCKDEVIAAKITHDQEIAHSIKLKSGELQWAALSPAYYFLPSNERVVTNHSILKYRSNAPPGLWQQIPLYKLHSGYTYYG